LIANVGMNRVPVINIIDANYEGQQLHLVDIFQFSFGDQSSLSVPLDLIRLLLFSIFFVFLSNKIHKRNLMKGL